MGTTNAQTNSGHDEDHSTGSSIDAFFAETVILLTGATGFLGKALLEKLLRSCPRIATIFVLIRPKRGLSVEQRFKELLNNPVFDRIRSEFPGTLNKIFPIKGDVGLSELGLQSEDRDMLIQRVNIVFHSAATVRFDEPLKIAVNLNLVGTDRMLDLCKRMTNLISVIHVSTAYCNADRLEIEESIYITEMKPHTVIDMCENLDNETLKIIEKKLIGKHPNTYTLTKGLAEQIVVSKGSGLPIAIVRPSIVCAAYQEPFPGWIDNTCGITGIMTEISRGTVRSIMCNANLVVDVVPVDFVVNALICASWHNFAQHTDTIRIYNCISSAVHPITWGEFGYLAMKHAIESPSKYVMWYPDVTFRTNKFIHTIIVATLHFLPAFIVDLILRVQGCKPIMMKIAKRFERAAKTGEFFATNEWKFHANNMMKLVKFVKTSEECSNFDVDIRNIDWDIYLHQYILGIRKYILKDNLDTLSNAKSRLLRLYWMHKITKILSIFMLLGIIRCVGR
ncbi:FACR1 reductase, partial [Pseudoatta argentina]